MWMENALYTIGKNVAGLGQKSPEQYEEALIGAEALVAIVKELKKRHNG